jgi:hypothetical protein
MTLGLPMIDYYRSPRPLIARLAERLPRDGCVAAPGASPAVVAALEHFGRWRVDATQSALDGPCTHLVRVFRDDAVPVIPSGWNPIAEVARPTDRHEITQVLQRAPR